jgi:hypothetical protein
MQPIVQAEFFHVDLQSGFDELFEEMSDRVHDSIEAVFAGSDPLSSGIKTTIRFYDEAGTIATTVEKLSRLNKQRWQEVFSKPAGAFGSVFSSLRWSYRRFQISRLEMQLHQTAIQIIEQRLSLAEGVAGQTSDFSFRYIRGNEKHELLQSVCKSKKALWFVFTHSDLLSDDSEVMTYYL